MADDPINIVVTDSVDPNIEKKLLAIASASEASQANLLALQSALASIRGDNLATLRDQANTVTSSIKAELDATNSLSSANNAARSSTDTLVNAKKDSRKAIDDETNSLKANTDAAKANAAAKIGIGNSPANLPRSPATIADTATIAQGTRSATGSIGKAQLEADAAAIAAASRAAKETEAAVEDLGTKAPGFFAKLKGAAATGFDAIKDFASGGGTRFRSEAETLAAGATKAGVEIETLGSKSHGSSTAIRELLVLAREGGRGDLTRMAGSASILAGALGLLPIALTLAAAGFGALYVERQKLNSGDEDAKLKAYAESLGLTEKEMRKLTDTTVDASGKMHEHNVLVVTYGDIISGTFATIRQGLAATFADVDLLSPKTKSVASEVLSFLGLAFEGFYAAVTTLVEISITSAKNLIKGTIDAFIIMFNAGAIGVQELANTVVKGINATSDVVNAISEKLGHGPVLGTIAEVNLGVKGILQNTMALDRSDIGAIYNKNLETGARTLKAIGASIDDNSKKAAQARILASANAIKSNRNPKKAPKPKKEANPKTKDDYLDDENLKLDNQIKLFGTLKDAREVQSQLDAIQEAFAKRRQPLNDAELKQFRDKLVLIQQNNKVQAEMDKIYNDLKGAQETFKVGQTALLELFTRGKISLDQYNQELVKMERTAQEAADPLFAMNEQLKSEAKALTLSGDALDDYNASEKVRQALLAKGIVLDKNATAAQVAEAKATLALAKANQNSTYVNGVVNPLTQAGQNDAKMLKNKAAFYQKLKDQRASDEIDEQTYQSAKYALDAKFSAMKLDTAKTTFDQLATLSRSKNKELALIGKVASVASATISGVEAVQNALATKAPWPIPLVLAGVAGVVAAANVAEIISTPVGSYNNGGDFIVRGKTGVDTNRISMNVSDGERVTVQTQAQQQTAANNNDKGGNGDTHVHNYFDEESFIGAMDSHRGEKVVMNIIGRRKNEVKGMVK